MRVRGVQPTEAEVTDCLPETILSKLLVLAANSKLLLLAANSKLLVVAGNSKDTIVPPLCACA